MNSCGSGTSQVLPDAIRACRMQIQHQTNESPSEQRYVLPNGSIVKLPQTTPRTFTYATSRAAAAPHAWAHRKQEQGSQPPSQEVPVALGLASATGGVSVAQKDCIGLARDDARAGAVVAVLNVENCIKPGGGWQAGRCGEDMGLRWGVHEYDCSVACSIVLTVYASLLYCSIRYLRLRAPKTVQQSQRCTKYA